MISPCAAYVATYWRSICTTSGTLPPARRVVNFCTSNPVWSYVILTFFSCRAASAIRDLPTSSALSNAHACSVPEGLAPKSASEAEVLPLLLDEHADANDTDARISAPMTAGLLFMGFPSASTDRRRRRPGACPGEPGIITTPGP